MVTNKTAAIRFIDSNPLAYLRIAQAPDDFQYFFLRDLISYGRFKRSARHHTVPGRFRIDEKVFYVERYILRITICQNAFKIKLSKNKD